MDHVTLGGGSCGQVLRARKESFFRVGTVARNAGRWLSLEVKAPLNR